MEVSFIKVVPDDSRFPYVRVIVHLHETAEEQPDDSLPLQSAEIGVWVEGTDAPLSEIKARAMKKVKSFLSHALKGSDFS